MIDAQNPPENVAIQPIAGSKKKMAIGWFSFTCCEDSTILLTEMLNDHLDEWKKLVDFKYIRALKTKNDPTNLDVAFVEGAISSDTQAKELQEIRNNAKYLIAIGSCACTGMPSASRNQFNSQELLDQKIQWYMSNFDYSKQVRRLEDVVKIDDKVMGCPMDPKNFLVVLQKYLALFKLI